MGSWVVKEVQSLFILRWSGDPTVVQYRKINSRVLDAILRCSIRTAVLNRGSIAPSLAELGEEITGPRWLVTGISRALQGAHSCPWLQSPEDMSRARTPCTCAFRNRAQPSSTHRACIVLGAGFVQRRVISTKHASSGEWTHMRLHLVGECEP